MRPKLLVILMLVAVGVPAWAAPPNAHTIATRMKAALEPARPSTRRIDMVIHSPIAGAATQWVAWQARKGLPDGNRSLTVLLDPADVKGFALLVQERKDKPDLQWVYLPALRRVRKIIYAGDSQLFLGSDFTYGDLGFFDVKYRTFKFLGEEQHAGTHAYKIQEVPRDPWFFSRVVTWVATNNFLPLERDYYDPAGALWKVERFENVAAIDGVPTPLHIVMEDKQDGGSSELRISQVRYGAEIPEGLFAPDQLPNAADSPLWRAAAAAPEKK